MFEKLSRQFKNKTKSEFLRNALTLMTGTTIAQIIPIITAPIITRIYSPEYYGIMGIYMSVSSLLSIISTLSYTSAILLPKEDEDALSLLHICMVSTLVWSVLVAILSLIFHNILAQWMNAPEVSVYFYLLPISILSGGWGNSFIVWAARTKEYRIISYSRVIAAILTALTSIGLGYVWKGPTGLIIGMIVNNLTVMIILFNKITKTQNLFKINSRKLLITQAKQYINFPKISLPTDFINTFVNQLPIYMLGLYAGKNEIGFYNFSNRILGLPITFISNAIGEVFKQRASSDYIKYGDCKIIFLKTLKALTIFSIIPFIILFVFAPDIFSFAFGEQWREAGIYTRILTGIYLLKFINSPLSYIIYIVQKQHWDLYMTIYWSITSAAALFIGLNFFNVYYALTFFSLNYCLIYFFMIRLNYNFSKGKR